MESAMPQNNFVSYVGTIDTTCAHPDGSSPENAELILDAIPVDLLDRFSERQGIIREQGLGENEEVGFLLLRMGANVLQAKLDAGTYFLITVTDAPQEGNDWFESTPLQFGNEDNENSPLYVRFEEESPREPLIEALEVLAGFSHLPDMESQDTFILGENEITAIAVYDVGQASMNALVNAFEHPVMFFDFGWPAAFNTTSIPKTLKYFNPMSLERDDINVRTPVVLSHLDWDHWAYAYQSGRAKWDPKIGAWVTVPTYRPDAIKRPWLMRRPQLTAHKLGPSHIHFVDTLSKTKLDLGGIALNFWPEKKQELNLGGCTIFSCNPASGSRNLPSFLRNNQGLGMLIFDSHSGSRTLLPGDADYPSIPDFAKQRLTGLVATHHGGKVTKGSIPNATAHGRMVFSVFPGCYSNMPHPDVESEAYLKGWHIARTSERVDCFRINTPKKQIKCGNRLIRLAQETPQCGCNRVPNGCLCITKP